MGRLKVGPIVLLAFGGLLALFVELGDLPQSQHYDLFKQHSRTRKADRPVS